MKKLVLWLLVVFVLLLCVVKVVMSVFGIDVHFWGK